MRAVKSPWVLCSGKGHCVGKQLWEESACNRAGPLPWGAQLTEEVRGTDVIRRHPQEPGK